MVAIAVVFGRWHGICLVTLTNGVDGKKLTYTHIIHVASHIRRRTGTKAEVSMDHDALKDTQTDFYNLIDNRQGEPSESSAPEPRKRKATNDGVATAGGEARLRQHPLADTVPPRTPAQRRQLAAAMELLRDAGDGADCHVEVLTLGDKVLWDYERYEIARELGLEVRPIPFRGSDPAVRLCIETLHAPEFNGGLRALIAVVSCEWAARGRPVKLTLGVSFSGTPWKIKEMATLGRVGTTRISEAKEICKFGLENLVLTRELAFGEALKRIQLVRAADLAESVQAGELTFDAAYERAWLKAKVDGADEEPGSVAKSDAATPNQVATLSATAAEWEREKSALQERIRELTAENVQTKHELEATKRALDDERVLREVAQEAIQDMKCRLEAHGFDV